MRASSFFASRVFVTVLLTGGCSPVVAGRGGTLASSPEAARAPYEIRWTKRLRALDYAPTHPEEFAGAETARGMLWVGSLSGESLWALRVADGRVVWRRPIAGGVLATPKYVSVRDTLYVGGGDGCLRALDPWTGAERWKYCTNALIEAEPAYHNGVVYFSDDRNRVFALDARTGKWLWSYDRPMPSGFTIRGHGAPVLWGDRVFVGFADGYLACLDAGSGDTIWTRDLREGASQYVDVDDAPVIVRGVLYVSSYAGGVYALDPKLGALLWRFPVKAASGVVVSDDRVYFASAVSGLYCLDGSGRVIYHQELDVGTPSAPQVFEDMLIFSSSRKGLLFADRDTGRFLDRLDFGYGVSAPPKIQGRSLYVLENGGTFVAAALY